MLLTFAKNRDIMLRKGVLTMYLYIIAYTFDNFEYEISVFDKSAAEALNQAKSQIISDFNKLGYAVITVGNELNIKSSNAVYRITDIYVKHHRKANFLNEDEVIA